MEIFNLTANAGWQLLSDLLAAAGYTSNYQWRELHIINTHGANTLQVKPKNGSTAPTAGRVLAVNGGSLVVQSGPFNGKNIWVNPSGATTTFDVVFIRS